MEKKENDCWNCRMNLYPRINELKKIIEWEDDNWTSLLAFVYELWNHNYGKWNHTRIDSHPGIEILGIIPFESMADTYELCTGGWSDNEDLVYALKENKLFWAKCWDS